MRRLARAALCRLGLHRWQYLMAPPAFRKGDDYEPAIWCIFCGARSPIPPGRLWEVRP